MPKSNWEIMRYPNLGHWHGFFLVAWGPVAWVRLRDTLTPNNPGFIFHKGIPPIFSISWFQGENSKKKKFETHSNAGCPPSSKVIIPQPKQEKIHKKTFWNHHVTIVIIVFFCLPLKLIVYHHLSSIITIYHLSSPFIIMSYHLIIIDHSFPPNFLGDVKIPPSKKKQTKKDMKLFSLSQWTLK